MRFRDTAEFLPTLDAVGEALDISATAVEKEYWVSEILRTLALTHFDDFIFKGGTSLSMGYGIIERFSEDIDILVRPGDRGREKVDKLMKAMGEEAAAGVAGRAEPTGGAQTGRHRSFNVHYPATREATSLISTTVLLELGVRGGPDPHEVVPIRSLLGKALSADDIDLGEFEDLAPFDVRVLHPARTLLEKLVYIHRVALDLTRDENRSPDVRSARHIYDVHCLLEEPLVLEFLQDNEAMERAVLDIDQVTATFFRGDKDTSGRPAGGFASSPAFDPGVSASARLRAAYEDTMPHLYFGHAPLPTWHEICAAVAKLAELL